MHNTRLGHVMFLARWALTCTWNVETCAFLHFCSTSSFIELFLTIANCFCMLIANLCNNSAFINRTLF